MCDKFINSLIASIIGCLTAIGTVWFLSNGAGQNIELKGNSGETAKVTELEVDRLKINGTLVLVDSKTGKALVEIKEGGIYTARGITAQDLAVEDIRTRRVQLLKGDFKDVNASVYGELGLKPEGGSYLALLSAQGGHSVNMGFNNNETGFIISRNNKSASFVAQAIFPIPDKSTLPKENTVQSAGKLSVPSNSSDTPFGPNLPDMTVKSKNPIDSVSPMSSGQTIANNAPVAAPQSAKTEVSGKLPAPENKNSFATGTPLNSNLSNSSKTTVGPILPSNSSTTTGPILPSNSSTTTGPILPSNSSTATGPILPSNSSTATGPILPSNSSTTTGPILPSNSSTTTGPILPSNSSTTTGPILPSNSNTTTGPILPSNSNTVPVSTTGGSVPVAVTPGSVPRNY